MNSHSGSLPNILFEDSRIIAFDKPSGLLVAPDRWDKDRPNLMALIHERYSPDCFNAHRLDAGTSGVLLCARDKAALKELAAQFETRSIRKRYLALVRGAPVRDESVIDAPLAEDPARPGAMLVAGGGKAAVTRVAVIERFRGWSLVEAWPQTGRTHQVRAHLAHVGCPIVCDPLYGNVAPLFLSRLKPGYRQTKRVETPLMGRLALHAERIEFINPTDGMERAVLSPMPRDFEIALKYLRRFAPA